jgi:hypothetical protein
LEGNVQPHAQISACRLDWSEFAQNSSSPKNALPVEAYDMIVGADIVYEAEHAAWIRRVVETVLKKPRETDFPDEHSVFHLIVPLRHTHRRELSTITRVFAKPPSSSVEGELVLAILFESQDVRKGAKEGDEVVYAYYRIGWTKVESSCVQSP